MSDIARLAGVSESTVSRALSGSTLINEKTRTRIQALAEEHNYAINRQAQNLRLQQSRIISVIIPIDHEPRQHVSDPFFLDLLGAIADAVTEADYDLLLSRVHTRDWRKRVTSHSYVDGLVIIGQSVVHDDINNFALINTMPLVVWGEKQADQHYISVGTDNYQGGVLAAQHLLEQGRKQIAFIGDHNLPEVAARFKGFRETLEREGGGFDPDLTFISSFATESAETAMAALLASGKPFDGIFAASDVLAIFAIRCLAQAGKQVPADVSVIGFDDITMARHSVPALTTISQNIYHSGQVLVDNLFRQIRGEVVSSVVVPPLIKIRDSS